MIKRPWLLSVFSILLILTGVLGIWFVGALLLGRNENVTYGQSKPELLYLLFLLSIQILSGSLLLSGNIWGRRILAAKFVCSIALTFIPPFNLAKIIWAPFDIIILLLLFSDSVTNFFKSVKEHRQNSTYEFKTNDVRIELEIDHQEDTFEDKEHVYLKIAVLRTITEERVKLEPKKYGESRVRLYHIAEDNCLLIVDSDKTAVKITSSGEIVTGIRVKMEHRNSVKLGEFNYDKWSDRYQYKKGP